MDIKKEKNIHNKNINNINTKKESIWLQEKDLYQKDKINKTFMSLDIKIDESNQEREIQITQKQAINQK